MCFFLDSVGHREVCIGLFLGVMWELPKTGEGRPIVLRSCFGDGHGEQWVSPLCCWLPVAGAGLRAFFPRIQERPSVAGAVSPPLLFQKVIRNYFILEKSFIFVFVL